LPDVPGAYLLLIDLPRPASLPPRFAATLPPGLYVYAGSAHGPGGIRARAGRHLRRDKPQRWHVDWLTASGTTTALALQDGHECAAIAALAAHKGFATPVRGFGSSDCRTCAAHLLRW
jgi:Uri superfamily endonuclease